MAREALHQHKMQPARNLSRDSRISYWFLVGNKRIYYLGILLGLYSYIPYLEPARYWGFGFWELGFQGPGLGFRVLGFRVVGFRVLALEVGAMSLSKGTTVDTSAVANPFLRNPTATKPRGES